MQTNHVAKYIDAILSNLNTCRQHNTMFQFMTVPACPMGWFQVLPVMKVYFDAIKNVTITNLLQLLNIMDINKTTYI